MDEKFLKPYDPKATEDKIYKLWEKSGFFNPDVCIESLHTRIRPSNNQGILRRQRQA